MTIKAGLFSYLSAQLTAKVYPIKMAQGASLPVVTYRRTHNDPDHNLTSPLGTSLATFSVDSWALTYTDADTLAESVRQAMDGYSGTMGTVDVRSVKLTDEADDYEPPIDASDIGVYHVTQLYTIRYTN